MITDGMLEDFFDAWYPEHASDYAEDFFNPNKETLMGRFWGGFFGLNQ
jgi:hypothetical protein